MNRLKTALDGNMSNDGVMFDIIASPSKSVMVKSLSFYSTKTESCDVEVYTKLGSHEYFEQTRNAWTNIVNKKTQCMGPQLETIIDETMFKLELTEQLAIMKGERRAFYIRVEGTELIYSATLNYNQVYVEDNNIQVLEGSGVSGYFLDYVVPRMWNGEVRYDLVSSEDDRFDDCSSLLEVNVNEGGGSSNKNYGIMFDIQSKANEELVIEGLAFFTGQSVDKNYEIYTIPSGFEYGEMSLKRWRKIGEGVIVGDFDSVIIAGKNFETITLGPGMTQGFYITLQSPFLLYRTTSLEVGSTYVQNNDIVVSVGIGVGEYPLSSSSAFYNSRGLYGKVLYGLKSTCELETTATYNFVVYYPKEWTEDDVFQEIAFIVKSLVLDIINSDGDFKEHSKANDLKFSSILPFFDTSGSSSCANLSADLHCSLIATNVTLTHDIDMDPGMITFGLLKNSDAITEGLNGGNLEVYYAGDEPLDTTVLVTLNGVPRKRMGLAELNYFQAKTKEYLRERVETGSVEILGVEVERQALDVDMELIASESKLYPRALEEYSASIDLTTVVTGKHRPPSPGLDFNILIEDSINAENSDFKEELVEAAATEAGTNYFDTIDDISAERVISTPTKAPGPEILVYNGSISEAEEITPKGLGAVAIVGIVIGAAIFAFLVVFGAFILYRRQQEQKHFELESIDDEYDDDEESPLFHDILKRQKDTRAAMLKSTSSRRRSTVSTFKSDQVSDPSLQSSLHSPPSVELTLTNADDHGQGSTPRTIVARSSYSSSKEKETSNSLESISLESISQEIDQDRSDSRHHKPSTRRMSNEFSSHNEVDDRNSQNLSSGSVGTSYSRRSTNSYSSQRQFENRSSHGKSRLIAS